MKQPEMRAMGRTAIASLAGVLALMPLNAAADTAPAGTLAAAAVQGAMVGPALYVSDPARSLRFYTEGLGMKLRMRFGTPERPDMVVGFGSDPAQPGIMLITDKDAMPRPIEHSHGFDRVAFRLPNLPAVADRLRAAGFEAGEIKVAHGSISVMMVTDPDGYRIELIDTMPASRPR